MMADLVASRSLRVGLACLPTLVIIALIELSCLGIVSIPIPFLLLMVAVGFAGYVGGRLAGTLGGALAAVLVLHGYFVGLGPRTLTGTLSYTLAGMALYTFVGFILGRLRDQRDAHYQALLESQRRDQEEPLLLASQLIGLGYYVWDVVKDEPVTVSDQHLKTFGRTREQFLALFSRANGEVAMVHPDDREKVARWREKLNQGETMEMEYRVPAPGGPRWVRAIVRPYRDDAGRVVREIGATLDVTAQKATETHLAEAQKLESVGRLTAGIAHDFNNLLAVILGNLELISDKVADAELAELVDAAMRSTLRGGDLTKKLLAFGRKTLLNPDVLSANLIIREMEEVFRRTLPATIEVKTNLADDLWQIEIDRSQFENALLNVVINARDAMSDTGTLTIESANVRLDEMLSDALGAEVEPGRYVVVTVSDTGTGIPPGDLQKVFEPFFTTKDIDKGTGLGLPLVYGFAKQSGGSVRINSEVGKGTSLRMFFPATQKPARTSPRQVEESQSEKSVGVHVLVVEDDQDVRKVLVRQLCSVGFKVFEAEDALSALDALRSKPTIRLLITDMVMPGEMQGAELADIASEAAPNLKVILLTGYAKSEESDGSRNSRSFTKLSKPVRFDELIRTVNEEMAGL